MMPESQIPSDQDFAHLCSHYKDTYEIQAQSIKLRDSHFYYLLGCVGLFHLQSIANSALNQIAIGYIKKQFDFQGELAIDYLGGVIWLGMFGLSTRYFQAVVNIERQYEYLHALEDLLNAKFPGTVAFTREGKSYLNEYPMFSNWIWVIYTIAFPLFLLWSIYSRISQDVQNSQDGRFGYVALEFSLYLLIGTSIVLYFIKLHGGVFRSIVSREFWKKK